MNCPNCGGHGKKYKHIKDGDSTYKQHKCIKCGNLFHTVETECPKEEFLIRQNEQRRRNHLKRCMRMYQGAEV